ncbi:MAG: helix-turn-helix transcriptional regulator [Gammaproteobacteria bacterium]|nr:helix-turn-helix transcriptional regulator [Gammaproteobacteria bacterium]
MKVNAGLILKLRKKKSWSQEELAIASGLNLRTIQRIEREASASMQSKKALAAAFGIDVNELNYEETQMQSTGAEIKLMKFCPECHSDNVYRYEEYVTAEGGAGPDLLPKLAPSLFAPAMLLPVVCVDCGYIRFYAAKDALKKLEDSKHWSQSGRDR